MKRLDLFGLLVVITTILMPITATGQSTIPAYTKFRAVYGFPNNGSGDAYAQDAKNSIGTTDAVESHTTGNYVVVGDYWIDYQPPYSSPLSNQEEHALKFLEIDGSGNIAQENLYYVNHQNGVYGNPTQQYNRIVRICKHGDADEQFVGYFAAYNYLENSQPNHMRAGVLALDQGLNKLWDDRFKLDSIGSTDVRDSTQLIRAIQIIPLSTEYIAVLSEVEVFMGPIIEKYIMITEISLDDSQKKNYLIQINQYDLNFFDQWAGDVVEYDSGYYILSNGSYDGSWVYPIITKLNKVTGTLENEVIEVPVYENLYGTALVRINRTMGDGNPLNEIYVAATGKHAGDPTERGVVIELPGDLFGMPSHQPKWRKHNIHDISGFHDIIPTIMGCNQMGITGYGFAHPGQDYTALAGVSYFSPLIPTFSTLLDSGASVAYGDSIKVNYGDHIAGSEADLSQIMVGRTLNNEIHVEKIGIDQASALADYSLPDCDETILVEDNPVDDGNYVRKTADLIDSDIFSIDPGSILLDIEFERVNLCSQNYPEQECGLPPGTGFSWDTIQVILPPLPGPKALGVSETKDGVNHFNLFPSPTTGEVYIKSDLEVSQVEVLNLSGTLILSTNSDDPHSIKLNLSNQAAGVYVVRIYTTEGLWTGRLLKQN